MAALFAMVGRWGTEGNVDVIATNAPAWQLAMNQTLEVDFIADTNPWIEPDKDGRSVSNRSPGLIATAYPAYAVLRPDAFTNTPGTLTALFMTLGALYLIYRLLLGHFGQPFALGSTVVLGLGTTTWTISASQLWPHGPGQFWMAVALATLANARYVATGSAFALAILIRPITAVSAAATGLGESWRLRSWKPAAEVGGMSLLGVGLLAAYNRWLFGTWSVVGAQSGPVAEALERFDFGAYVGNVFEMFIGLPNGFLVFSPFIVLASFGALTVWTSIPSWARAAAIASVVYLLAHAAVNRASGGMVIFYRYPLEAITLAAGALAWGGHALWQRGGLYKRLLVYSVVYSIAIQFVNAFVISCRSVYDFPSLCSAFG